MKNIHLLAIIGISAVVVIMSLSLVHGQITDSPYFPCIESVDKTIELNRKDEVVYTSIVVLVINSSNNNTCTPELFFGGTKYYKSQGYNETEYSKDQYKQEITLTKETRLK